jgi:hypothetical protein
MKLTLVKPEPKYSEKFLATCLARLLNGSMGDITLRIARGIQPFEVIVSKEYIEACFEAAEKHE